jgi:hypothetical protein
MSSLAAARAASESASASASESESESETSSLLGTMPAQIPEINLSIDQNIFEHDGNWYVIYKSCDNMTNEVIDEISPLYELNSPDNVLEPGVYTWMITTDKSNVPHLYVKKTLFFQEIQTKHSNIVYELQNRGTLGNVYYAGELKISVKQELNFNFLSGSYMLDRELTKPNEDAVLKFFKNKFPRYGVTYDIITPGKAKTYITADAFEMNEERFELLKRVCPNSIYRFDTKNEANSFSKFEFDNAKFTTQIKMKQTLLENLEPKLKPDANPSETLKKIADKTKAEIGVLEKQIKTLADYQGNIVTEGGGKNKKKYSTRKKQKRLRKKKTTRQKK